MLGLTERTIAQARNRGIDPLKKIIPVRDGNRERPFHPRERENDADEEDESNPRANACVNGCAKLIRADIRVHFMSRDNDFVEHECAERREQQRDDKIFQESGQEVHDTRRLTYSLTLSTARKASCGISRRLIV